LSKIKRKNTECVDLYSVKNTQKKNRKWKND